MEGNWRDLRKHIFCNIFRWFISNFSNLSERPTQYKYFDWSFSRRSRGNSLSAADASLIIAALAFFF